MRIKKKLKPKLIDEIKLHQEFRKDLSDFIFDFTLNVSIRYDCMMKTLDAYREGKIESNKCQILAGQYLSSLITCWETVFRDMFAYTINQNKELENSVSRFLKNKGILKSHIINADISLGEFFCKQFNFQNLEETRDALNFILQGEYDNIGEFAELKLLPETHFHSQNIFMYWHNNRVSIKSEVMKVLEKAFDIRHKVIHDSNYRLKIEPKFMSNFEDIIIILPQFITIHLALKYNMKILLTESSEGIMKISKISSDGYKPLVLSKRDFNEEYYIVD